MIQTQPIKKYHTRAPHFRGQKGQGDIMKKETTGKAQAGTQAQADSKRKGKATAEAQASQQAQTSKPTADKPAGRAEAEAAALAMVGEVKSHTGGRINLDSVRICPRKAGKVKAFLRPTYIVPVGITLQPYEAGGFTGWVLCDLNTEAGRQTLAALIAAQRKPTAAEAKAAKAEADKASKGKASQQGKADSKPASKGKADKPAEADKATGQQATQQASQQAGKGKGQADKATDKASKPTGQQGKGKAGKGKAEAQTTATA